MVATLEAAGTVVHTCESFVFTAPASIETVMPLFGAEAERVWAPGWAPNVLWPSPAADREGMVFTIAHAGHDAIWLNTQFSPADGRAQYAYVLPGAVATLITLNAVRMGEQTHVTVVYERTALDPAMNERVQAMAAADRVAGPEWQAQIAGYLAALRGGSGRA